MPLPSFIKGNSGLLIFLQIIILEASLACHIESSLLLLEDLFLPYFGLFRGVNVCEVNPL